MAKNHPPQGQDKGTGTTNPFQFDDGQPSPRTGETTRTGSKETPPNPGEAANRKPDEEVAHPTMPQP
jgi:hypothetical protein